MAATSALVAHRARLDPSRDSESFTSFDLPLNSPFEWVLKHAAGLRPSGVLAVSDYPWVVGWIELERVGKVQVQRDQCAPLAFAVQDQIVIERRLQMLLRNGADIVTRPLQHHACVIAEVLVELELHATSSIGIGT